MTRDEWNAARLPPRGAKGHYESWFLRANHPAEPLAIWIRYTLFRPRGHPEATVGELWAAFFERAIVGVREELEVSRCLAATTGLDLTFGAARWTDGALRGAARGAGHQLEWDLRYPLEGEPSPIYPPWAYRGSFPKAKAVTPVPATVVSGVFIVDGVKYELDRWPGSQNHNWGERHTDEYAWVQVCGFDQAPDAFFEGGTGRLRVGGLWTPQLSAAVLTLDGRRYELNRPMEMLRARGRARGYEMSVATRGAEVELELEVRAARERFVAFRYRNPPGGMRACLNSKVADCELIVRVKRGVPRRLTSRRAAFELLLDERDPRVAEVGGYPAGE